MQQNNELLETGLVEEFKAEKLTTIQDIMNNLNLDMGAYAILINDQKAEPSDIVNKDDDIVIIPCFKGG